MNNCMVLVLLGSIGSLMSCQKHLKKPSVAGLQNVDQLDRITAKTYNVYCPTGICKLKIEGAEKASIVVNMYYDQSKPFGKIEGAYTTEGTQGVVTILSENQIDIKAQQMVYVQVVDYFRN